MPKKKKDTEEQERLVSETSIRVHLHRLFQLIKPEALSFLFLFLLNFLDLFIDFVENQTLGSIVDCLSFKLELSLLHSLSVRLCFTYLSQSMVVMLRSVFSRAIGRRIAFNLKARLFQAIAYQEIEFFDSNKSGALASRLSEDASCVEDIPSSSINIVMAIIKVFCSIGYLIYMSWKLTLLMVFAIPVIGISLHLKGNTDRKAWKDLLQSLSVANEKVIETFSQIKTVRAFGQEQFHQIKYLKHLKKAFDYAKKVALYRALTDGIVTFSFNLCIVIGLWYGGSLVLSEEMTTGSLISYCFFALGTANSFGDFPTLMEAFNKIFASNVKIFEIIANAERTKSVGTETLPLIRGKIAFKNVCFAYPSRPDVMVLKNFTLMIENGKRTALIGPSGSGKSTLIALLEGFYYVNEGQITLDGVNIEKMDLNWLRRQIGLVSQEPVLFADTIANNIAYGCITPDDVSKIPTKAQIEAAAKMANAHDFIMKLPHQYETMVGERGSLLSGGEKQRLAIARALLRNPSILLLDEATSALDNESERLVQEALERLMKGRTSVIIAHRLSTVQNSDLLVYIEHGSVVETGTHEQLMSRKSGYYNLFIAQ
eukprot:TRINITY_DN5414_c0_g1_i1.p1 TRINITY_DN5414_c0_g1~~TRINITY_DN5414_c0_g1_i1.p1  ORF type:complete len:598 (+),score=66.52 TRINITY_DN5414_c0_g1_i1:87-1880(+)